MLRKSRLIVLFVVLILLGQTSYAAVKNVILMIGDGMGFEHVKAASLYAYGEEGELSFERYYRGEMMTHSANSHRVSYHATDSAAAATAMATGEKVNNGIISEQYRKRAKQRVWSQQFPLRTQHRRDSAPTIEVGVITAISQMTT